MLDLFVLDAAIMKKVPVVVRAANEQDLAATHDWQTNWNTPFALQLPNKVAPCWTDDSELHGLMSYELDQGILAVERIYMESARHSNANLLHAEGGYKRYYGIAKALFAYAVQISLDARFDVVLVFNAKTSELLEYYRKEYGVRRVAAYDPFQPVIWKDAAERDYCGIQEAYRCLK